MEKDSFVDFVSRKVEFIRDFFGQPGQRLEQGFERRIVLRSRDDDQIDSHGEFGPGEPEGLAQQPFPAVPRHGVAHLARNRKSQAGIGQPVGAPENQNSFIRRRTTALVRPIEIGSTANAILR